MSRRTTDTWKRGARYALPAFFFLLCFAVTEVLAVPYPTTREDFHLPGTQPLTVTDAFAPPNTCAGCHSNYGSPNVEPFRSWRGSMMAQSGRDPLMLAALAVANQDFAHAGETCLRCHYPKGWLEGHSVPEDGTGMTAGDREGVQCTICHRMVDPFPAAENPPQDTAILAGLAEPVTLLSSAMMVMDPQDRLRGPFDVIDDLGSDPHLPIRPTLVSAFHRSSELCGVCHNVTNLAFTRNMSGEYELNALDTPGDPALGFPEQSTYDEWAASTYATTGIFAPQFGRNKATVSTCQDCHMPAVSGRDALGGFLRDDVPLHELVGGNTFIPKILPHHPAFGAEVDANLLASTVDKATVMLRKSATVSATLAGGTLTVRVTNESGHKLPTGYPDGRRMWLHVRGLDDDRNVVFESGRYVFSTADLVGYDAEPIDSDYDPNMHVWETVHGSSPALAVLLGVSPGPSQHLVRNNVREKDNRIPPRGFTNAAFEAFDGDPVGATYADGEYWDDVTYPVGAAAVAAEVTLYYQTASREYVEFLRDTNVTNAAGNVLFDLWDQHGKAEPVAIAQAFVTNDVGMVQRCQKTVSRLQAKYHKAYAKEWGRCYATEVRGLTCNAAERDAKVAAAEAKLREKLGGLKDSRCAGVNLTPITLGHGPVCPVPCPTLVLFDIDDLASCAVCTAAALAGDALDAAYGLTPPAVPSTTLVGDTLDCQQALAKAAGGLVTGWTDALRRCEERNLKGAGLDCATDPEGRIARAKDVSARRIAGCDSLAGLSGCAAGGDPVATEACFEAAIGADAGGFTGVAYP